MVQICISLINVVKHFFMFIDYLQIFYGKMSFQILFNWVISLLLNCKNSVYILDTSYQIHDLQILSIICGLSSHFLNSVLWGTKVFNFDEVNLSIFTLVVYALGVMLKNYWLIQIRKCESSNFVLPTFLDSIHINFRINLSISAYR